MRDLQQIDNDLRCERAILLIERRSGDTARPTIDTRHRLDALLDERSMVLQHMRSQVRRPVPR